MNYLAFRIDTKSIKNNKVTDGFFVRGQRTVDMNWPMLAEFSTFDKAKQYIKSIMTDNVRQIVYDNNGYAIRV